VRAALDQPVRQRRRERGEGQGTGRVHAALHGARTRQPQTPAERHGQRDSRDRQVDQEDGPPAELVGEQPAEDRADGGRGAVDRAPDAERGAPVTSLVGAGDQGGGRGHHRRPAEALDGAGGDQRGRVGGGGAHQRGGGEDHQPGEVEPAVAEPVTERAADHQQRGQRQGVDVHHPLEGGERRMQVGGHLGQRDIHDADVDEQHEGADADGCERYPLTHGGLR
jgi:hypothetical protein